MKVVSFDLGSMSFAYSIMDEIRIYDCRTWDLCTSYQANKNHPGFRWSVLRGNLEILSDKVRKHGVQIACYEKVRRHNSTASAHAYGGCQSFVLEWCMRNGLDVLQVPVQSAKIAATGRGDASKEHVMKRMEKRFDWKFDGCDASDAASVGLHYLQQVGLADMSRPIYSMDEWLRKSKVSRMSPRNNRNGELCALCGKQVVSGEDYGKISEEISHLDCFNRKST